MTCRRKTCLRRFGAGMPVMLAPSPRRRTSRLEAIQAWFQPPANLQIAAQRLPALDGLEERLEVALSKATRAFTLNDLEEDGWAILHVLGEDLQQIAIVVAVHQNAQLRQFFDWFVYLADAPFLLIILAVNFLNELYALLSQLLDGGDDVAGNHGDVLHARRAVIVQIFFDLRLLAANRRLIDWELDLAVAALHHLRHQRGIFGADGLVGEVNHLGEAHHIFVELDPLVHLAKLDVANHMIYRAETAVARQLCCCRFDGAISRQEWAIVVAAFDEAVNGLAVGVDGSALDLAMLIFGDGRLHCALCATRQRIVIRLLRVRHFQCDIFCAVAVQQRMLRNGTLRAEAAAQHEANLALLDDIAGAVAQARLQAGIGDRHEAEGAAIIMGGLFGVADVELDVVPVLDRHEIGISHK